MLISIGQRLAGVYAKERNFQENQQGASNSTDIVAAVRQMLIQATLLVFLPAAAETQKH